MDDGEVDGFQALQVANGNGCLSALTSSHESGGTYGGDVLVRGSKGSEVSNISRVSTFKVCNHAKLLLKVRAGENPIWRREDYDLRTLQAISRIGFCSFVNPIMENAVSGVGCSQAFSSDMVDPEHGLLQEQALLGV